MKKRLYRIATYLLILTMLLTNLPMAMASEADALYYELGRENPYFEGMEAPAGLKRNAPLYFSGAKSLTYHTSVEAAAQEIREAMKARESSFTVGFIVDERKPQDEAQVEEWLGEIAFDLLLDTALEETDDPTEGDSLRFSYYGELPVGAWVRADGNRSKLEITYEPTYFTNAAQEAALNQAVDELMEEFAFTARTTEQQKIQTIYQWLCDNVDYDHTSYGYLKHSAYAALVRRTAVCEGYAVLFYRLAEEAGLDARVITGVATSSGELHGWNIVRQGEQYYYLDSTWDANKYPWSYDYYLRGAADFRGHRNDAEYATAQFTARYPIPDHRWEQRYGEAYHWQYCEGCDAIRAHAAHSGGKATCKAQAQCTTCNQPYGGLADHQWGGPCDVDCNTCGIKRTSPEHQFGDYVYNEDATSRADGTQTRTCAGCGETETVPAEGTKLKNPFKDVSLKEYYAEPVLWAVSKKITNGTSEETFSPASDCTRGQIVTFLWRAAGSPEPKSTKNPFKDVKSDQYYYKAVLWAVEKGITTGTAADTFSPDAACTRGQVVAFLHRAQGKPDASGSNAFKDVKAGEYYYDAVRWAVKNEITNGMSATSFAPDSTCTRGQIVTFLYRSHK